MTILKILLVITYFITHTSALISSENPQKNLATLASNSVALTRVKKTLDDLKQNDQSLGAQIVRRAHEEPLHIISSTVENAKK